MVGGELRRIDAAEVAATLGQDPEHPLMEDFARALCDVSAHVGSEYGGGFGAVVDAAAGSAVALAELLASWDAFADVSTYEGRRVPFYKRAQLAAADLDRAGVASFPDLDRLTAFADNLVPHVLRLDGVLRLDPSLEREIEAGALLAAAAGGRLSPAAIDAALWNRGREPRCKAIPRPRCRNTAY